MSELNLGLAETTAPDLSPEQFQKQEIKLSPVMAQYLEMKKEYSDALLFFRLGDFYELFFEDAVTAAKALDIVLTRRGKNEGNDIPMCGVPAHAYESYLARLIQKGFKVAICEQLEDPASAKKRGAKGPLKRDVVRVVTPGTITEENMLEARQSNFLIAVSPVTNQHIGIAIIELSTGAFLVEQTDLTGLPGVLSRLNPAEIIIPDRLITEPSLYDHLNQWKRKLSPLPLARFDHENGKLRLENAYQVKTIDAFGNFSQAEIRAAGTLIDYIQVTQKAALRLIDRPRQIKPQSIMTIDAPTRRSLELHLTQAGHRQGSLMDTIDMTVTAAGSRLLSMQLAAPLLQLEAIQERQDNVTYFVNAGDDRQFIRDMLKQTPDMERALSRLNMMRGSPRDLACIRDGLTMAMQIRQKFTGLELSTGLKKHIQRLGHHTDLTDKLTRALAEELPFYTRDGGFIAEGYHGELDTYRYLRDNTKDHIAQLQGDYIARTGINSLKIKHNNIIGYHIDITPSHATKVPEDFIHRQTLASSLRYSTPELAELERKITVAAHQVMELELQIFNDLVSDIHLVTDDILRCCRALAGLDIASALAELAYTQGYCCPTVDQSLTFQITGGFHPVVASLLKERGETTFVANGCHMDDGAKVFLITGPNMAGKSTYLRQNALMAILAQIGSYVPAQKAHIGIVDRIFSRVGASDDLASGRSTFMVEMVETAAILHQATERSFVILDEIGRGTATFDGLSIAWAVTEHIAQHNKCRTLFATHYHELTQLQDKIPTLKCLTMRIKEWKGKVIFMHEIIEGTADKSYGIHVAALAGLPGCVIQRATAILASLESERSEMTIPETPAIAPTTVNQLERDLLALDIDSLSPREALDRLYELKRRIA
ncbi:MAG: DNA mismatch repair protein MutS [Candidatus Paracaedibacteraceae bacterium]|nr:DNA mismatch repair protein MutS [Candidatus Paracaedibacteraceae bacterium]